ncbi:MAG: hypothetical protein RXO36_06525 [Candidatus Nanopusillus acidilobi]
MFEASKTKILVHPLGVEYTYNGFPFIQMSDDCQIYIPQDHRVRYYYAIKGTLTKGKNAYIIKKGSQNLVYIVKIDIIHYYSVVENITLSATSDVITVLNYDALGTPSMISRSEIRKVVEVSQNSKIQVSFTVSNERYTIFYSLNNYEIQKQKKVLA